jgi:hypothetical protein
MAFQMMVLCKQIIIYFIITELTRDDEHFQCWQIIFVKSASKAVMMQLISSINGVWD